MLATKKYDKDQIVSFKLVNGDEIVARIVSDDTDEFVLHKPCTAIPSQRGLGLIQTVYTGDVEKNITLNKHHVMLHTATIKDIENHYIKTTTGIEPVGNSGIIV